MPTRSEVVLPAVIGPALVPESVTVNATRRALVRRRPT